jgi:putative hydrolase of the HAD superfamily
VKALRAVVFDLYGTLTDPAVESRRRGLDAELAAVVGADPAAWSAAMRSSFTARATGAWGPPAQILRRLCDELRLDVAPDVFERAVEIRLAHHRRLTAPRPEAERVVRSLRDHGLRTAVLSDATPEIDETWRTFELRGWIDVAVFSCRLGRRKPASETYDAVTTRLGVRPQECLYVGDGSSGELRGAERAGMRALRIASDHGERLDPDTDWAGTTIARLDELLPIVGVRQPP